MQRVTLGNRWQRFLMTFPEEMFTNATVQKLVLDTFLDVVCGAGLIEDEQIS